MNFLDRYGSEEQRREAMAKTRWPVVFVVERIDALGQQCARCVTVGQGPSGLRFCPPFQ